MFVGLNIITFCRKNSLFLMVLCCGLFLWGSVFPSVDAAPIELPFTPGESQQLQTLPLIAVPQEVTQEAGVASIKQLVEVGFQLVRLVLGPIAVFLLVYSGYRLIIAQEQASDEIQKQRQNTLYILAGLIITALAGDFVYNIIFPNSGQFLLREDTLVSQAGVFTAYIKQFLNTLLSLSGAAAILSLVVASLRLVINPGGDEQIEQQKKLVGYTAVGIMVIGMADVLVNRIIFSNAGYDGVNITEFEVQLRGLSNYVLGFLGGIALVAFIVSGVIMVANFGNEELVGRVRTTLTNIVIGTLIAYSSYTIVATLIGTFLSF